MGKTVSSFRMALEFEMERWKGFKKALTTEEDREAFVTSLVFEPSVLAKLISISLF